MAGLDEYVANKIARIKCADGTTIIGHIIDESDLYYVVTVYSDTMLVFKRNICYIEIIGDESSEEDDD